MGYFSISNLTYGHVFIDRLLHICLLHVHELICKNTLRLRYINLYIDMFVTFTTKVS